VVIQVAAKNVWVAIERLVVTDRRHDTGDAVVAEARELALRIPEVRRAGSVTGADREDQRSCPDRG
jgi:hypothetical protein